MIVALSKVSAWYTPGVPVLENVDWVLKPGKIYGLLGMNGAGKTTLLHVLTGLHSRFSGDCFVGGSKLDSQSSANELNLSKKQRYFAPDSPQLFEEMTAFQYMNFVTLIYKKAWNQAYFQELVHLFRFTEYVDRTIGELSLGNRQKTALITGFLVEPPLYILDEPLNGLDIESIDSLEQQMKVYTSNGGTVIFSSHLLEMVERFCDEAFILNAKRIQARIDLNEGGDLREKLRHVIHDE